jgi:hypothetical protein
MTYEEAINHRCGLHCDGQDGTSSECYKERWMAINEHEHKTEEKIYSGTFNFQGCVDLRKYAQELEKQADKLEKILTPPKGDTRAQNAKVLGLRCAAAKLREAFAYLMSVC